MKAVAILVVFFICLNRTEAHGFSNQFNETEEEIDLHLNETETNTTMTMIQQWNTSRIVSTRNSASRTGWRLFICLLVAAVILIGSGMIYYRRRETPYRRFLRNWRPREDDNDNIILQLEQPDVISNHWPPRISFS